METITLELLKKVCVRVSNKKVCQCVCWTDEVVHVGLCVYISITIELFNKVCVWKYVYIHVYMMYLSCMYVYLGSGADGEAYRAAHTQDDTAQAGHG